MEDEPDVFETGKFPPEAWGTTFDLWASGYVYRFISDYPRHKLKPSKSLTIKSDDPPK